MVEPSLLGAWLKVRRAAEHFQAYREAIAANPKRIRAMWHYERDPGGFTWVDLKTVSLPEFTREGILLGDGFHCLRSALDHLCWQLALANPAVVDPFDRTQFVITTCTDRFDDASWRLRSLTDEHRDMVRRCQPYWEVNGTRPFEALSLLQEIDNADKHRLLLPVALVPRYSEASQLLDMREAESVVPYWRDGLTIELGTPLIRLKVVGMKPGFQVRMNYDLAPEIAFPSGLEIETAIERTARVVVRVLKAFEPFIDSPPLGLA